MGLNGNARSAPAAPAARHRDPLALLIHVLRATSYLIAAPTLKAVSVMRG